MWCCSYGLAPWRIEQLDGGSSADSAEDSVETKLSEMGRCTTLRLDAAASSGEGRATVELGLDR
jgi:hypothetical protein